jgi:hypothetical protein
MYELGLGIGGGKASQLFQSAALLAKELFQLLLALGQRLFAAAKGLGAASGVTLSLLEQVVFTIELAFAVRDAALFALDLFASSANFDLPFFAKSDQFFLTAEDSCLAQALGLALRFSDDPL